ncbi:hypothetical protein ACJJI4_21435 [Microbulbifer sp. TRSA002]|uniref:hypothetical protein n=1 Tax=Microbulbifer sp. TRSA002 TaxID=3243382 RepID=UPI004039D352
MKIEEKIVYRYFKSQGFLHIDYEPDGNIPPDFLLNNTIAVEVRRLNQHYDNGKSIKPLEDIEYKLVPQLNTLLKTFKGAEHKSSAFISISYSRPVGNIKDKIKEIERVLISHLRIIDQTKVYKISDQVRIRISPTPTIFDSPYNLGSINDMDQGGFVLSEIKKTFSIYTKKNRKKSLRIKINMMNGGLF